MTLKTPMMQRLGAVEKQLVQSPEGPTNSSSPGQTVVQRSRAVIGLTAIWREGEGVDGVSFEARVAQVVRGACANLLRAPVSASLTALTIAGAVFLVGAFLLLMQIGSKFLMQQSEAVAISIFLRDQASAGDVQDLARMVAPLVNGRAVNYTDKRQALDNFRKMLGADAGILDGIEADNPLPASLEVRIDSPEHIETMYRAVSERLKDHHAVDSVRFSRGVVQQLQRVFFVLKSVGLVIGLFLVAITAFIIANTIKLALYAHRTEVEIMRLIGARSSALYAPFVLEGVLQGIAGAFVGLAGVHGVFFVLRDAVARSELLQALVPGLETLSSSATAGCLGFGVVVGLIGSLLALRRFSRG